MRGILSTSIVIDDELGETEYDVRVVYQYDKGYRGDYYQPPEVDSIEIIDITPADTSFIVPESFYDDEALIAECFADVAEQAAEAAEWHAQSRRDALMGGF